MTTPIPDPALDPKFSRFTVHRAVYKVVNKQEIPVYVLVPKPEFDEGKKGEKWNVMVRIHGGYLVQGAALLASWIPPWVFTLALSNHSLLIMPDYRLLPESNGLELLSDIDDMWEWIVRPGHDGLVGFVGGLEDVKEEVDLGKVICTGESAGGYLAIQSAISHPSIIKSCVIAYPMVELDSPFYATPRPLDQLPGEGIPVPKSIITNHLASMIPGKITVASYPPERDLFDAASQQHGVLTELLGDADVLYPLRRMESVTELPFVFVFHGTDDTTVPIEDTEKFVEAYKKRVGAEGVLFRTAPGGHGFDNCKEVSDAEWMLDGLEEAKKRWLA